jgi:hypothetical protein
MASSSQTNKNSSMNLREKIFVERQECQGNFYDYFALNFQLFYKDRILLSDII